MSELNRNGSCSSGRAPDQQGSQVERPASSNSAPLAGGSRLTPWFSWPVVPVRIGWYDFRGTGVMAGMRLYWNGHEFGYWMHPSKKAFSWVAMADDESDQWRGLLKEEVV